MAEKTRYTDEELMEFKQLILQKIDIARADYDEILAALTHRNNNSVDDTSPTYKIAEEGYITQSKEELNTLAARQKKFIDNLQAALIRILRAVPHATLSIEAKQMKNRRD